MRSLALALALSLAALPLAAAAQTPLPTPLPTPESEAPPAEQGMDLIERGAGMIFENFWRDVQPQVEGAARELGDMVATFGPALQDLAALIDDIGNYQRPERLENGDILIRRKADAPPPPPLGEGLPAPAEPRPENAPPPPDPRAAPPQPGSPVPPPVEL
jgi:hypothetical protein